MKKIIFLLLLFFNITKGQSQDVHVINPIINYDSIINIVTNKIYIDFPFLMNLDEVIKNDVRQYSYVTEMNIKNMQNTNLFCLGYKRYKTYRKCMLNINNNSK